MTKIYDTWILEAISSMFIKNKSFHQLVTRIIEKFTKRSFFNILSFFPPRTQYFLIGWLIYIINSVNDLITHNTISLFTHISAHKYKCTQKYKFDTKNAKSFLQINFSISYWLYHFHFDIFIFWKLYDCFNS